MFHSLRSAFYCALRQSRWKNKYSHSEWFDILTPRGKVLGRAPREICHQGPFLLHGVVHLHLVDPQGRVYLQKRSSDKKIQPGKWDTSVGGHIDSGESRESALFRETREELGIEGFDPRTIDRYIWECPQEVEMVHSHWARWSGEDPRVDPVEIEKGRWWSAEEVEENLDNGIFTPNFCFEWRRFLKILLENPETGEQT